MTVSGGPGFQGFLFHLQPEPAVVKTIYQTDKIKAFHFLCFYPGKTVLLKK
jgi:hypothetical protein